MTHVALLEREVSAEAEAARLLNVAQSTLHSWLEGKTGRSGKVHRPVIRQEPKGPAMRSPGRSLSRRGCCISTVASPGSGVARRVVLGE